MKMTSPKKSRNLSIVVPKMSANSTILYEDDLSKKSLNLSRVVPKMSANSTILYEDDLSKKIMQPLKSCTQNECKFHYTLCFAARRQQLYTLWQFVPKLSATLNTPNLDQGYCVRV